MKFQKQKILICFGLCAAVFLAFTLRGMAAYPEESEQMRLDWNLETTVGAYQKVGNTNSAWDEPAIRALTEYVKITSQQPPPGSLAIQPQPGNFMINALAAKARSAIVQTNTPSDQIIATNCDAAIKAGCVDPMVRYLHVRYFLSQSQSLKAVASGVRDAALDLQKSSYPSIRKFYAVDCAMVMATAAYGRAAAEPKSVTQEMSPFIKQDLLDALKDKTTPPTVVYDACTEALKAFTAWHNDLIILSDDYSQTYSLIEPLLFTNWPDESFSWLIKGSAYVDMGWKARGAGADTAKSVTARKKRKSFQDDLAIAETSLNHAWELNPTDARIAVKMITVELGQGRGREQMELWFDRAMKADPGDYEACCAKLNYLSSTWFGSDDDMLAFGRECLNNTNWNGRVPLVLADAHTMVRSHFINPLDYIKYYRQPQAWSDLKASYDRYLTLNPNATDIYKDYASAACSARKWDVFLKLAPKIHGEDYRTFGGETSFNKLVQNVKNMVQNRQNGKNQNDSSQTITLTDASQFENNVTNTPDLMIISAKYGMGKDFTDVTAKVIDLLNANTGAFTADEKTLRANPLPGKDKNLIVSYFLAGTNYVFIVSRTNQVSSALLMENALK